MRYALAALVFVAGCNAQSGETLQIEDEQECCEDLQRPSARTLRVQCQGEALITISDLTQANAAVSCLGLLFDRDCQNGVIGPEPGSAACDDPAQNPLKGTCAERFFSCFKPVGQCSQSNSRIDWADGHAVTDEGLMFQPQANEPCIVFEDSGNSFLGSRRVFLKVDPSGS